jgi:hypothetical protein
MILQPAIGFGTVLAVTISWSLNKSIFWAIVHGAFGWLYVVYYAIGSRDHDNLK